MAEASLKTEVEAAVSRMRAVYMDRAASVFSGDPLSHDKARLAILEWAEYARVAHAGAAGADVSSYSIGGRSVTKNDLGVVRDRAAALLDEVEAMLGMGGGVLVGDCRMAGAL